MLSSHPSATSHLSMALSLDQAGDMSPCPEWESLAPPEQTAIQLRLEQSLSLLRQQLDEIHLSTLTQAKPDLAASILIKFLEQIHQNLGHSRFTLLTNDREHLDQFIPPSWLCIANNTNNNISFTRSQLLEGQTNDTVWQLSEAPIVWLVLTEDKTTGWMQTIQRTFIARAIAQLAVVLRSAQAIQASQTQLKSLEQQNQELAKASKLKSEFLANTSHEIRTPLSSILGFTHLLREKGFSPDNLRHQEYLRIILTSGQHLLALINDILDLSKIEANQMDLQWSDTELKQICKTALTLVKEKANDKGLGLKLDRPEECAHIQADPLRLKQMLFNLLSNAIKFTDAGNVGLRIRPDGQYMRFTVWDTGAGISPQQQAELFRAYSQLPQTEDNRSMGTGLGLALTQKLAELHGGWIEVESTVGEGSEFTVVLPVAPATAIVPPANRLPVEIAPVTVQTKTTAKTTTSVELAKPVERPKKKRHRPNRRYHILLVEDHQINARLMITYLCKLGYEVTWARDSDAMWKSLDQSIPAMILMDVNLPDVDGLTLTRQLRAHDKYKDLPIIAQTAMAMTGDKETCLEAGVNDYITKPIDLTKLADTLRQYSDPGLDR